MYSVFCQSIFKMKNTTFFFSLEKRTFCSTRFNLTKINDSYAPPILNSIRWISLLVSNKFNSVDF